MTAPADSRKIDAILAEVQSMPCWAARRGHGTFLTFDFGERRVVQTRRGSREVGAVHLWVYLAKWSLCAGDLRAGWDTPIDQVDATLRRFIGTSLVAIDGAPAVIRFGPSDNATIALSPLAESDEDDPLFMLYLPDHRVLSATQSGQIVLGDDRE